eukprot:15439617-Alexandrium_andersonii.AAC.1
MELPPFCSHSQPTVVTRQCEVPATISMTGVKTGSLGPGSSKMTLSVLLHNNPLRSMPMSSAKRSAH